MIFRLNGGFWKRKCVLFLDKRGIFVEEMHDFRVKWGIFQEKMRDFHLTVGFLKICVILAFFFFQRNCVIVI